MFRGVIVMGFWSENQFFMNFKNHIIKWYRLVILPVFHIDNSGSKQRFHTEGEEDLEKAGATGNDSASSKGASETDGGRAGQSAAAKPKSSAGGDAQAVLDRINNDREGRHLDEVERARQKAEEDARLASIMNANKVDVDSFIAQGKSAAKEAEEMRRAQEIIDRLNREAAADEAAKQAELDAAMEAAAEKFGN